jgi:Cu(I)/Ag(I) efflux system membrane fusion protein
MNKKSLIGSVLFVVVVVISTVIYLQMRTDSSSKPPAGPTSVPTDANTMPRFQVGEWDVAIATDPGTPRVGDNALIVELRDEQGNAVTDVNLDAYAEMPAMGSMQAMRTSAGLEQTAPGRFEGELNLSMRGEWPLTIQIIDPQGDTRQARFELATDRLGLNIAAGGTAMGGVMSEDDDDTVITIDNRRRQLIGLETGLAIHRDLVKSIRTVGQVTYDERLLSEVSLKFDGYIGELSADYVGAEVHKGQVLFTVYSPAVLAAQREYLETWKRRANLGADDTLLGAARKRLTLWDLSAAAIDALERRGVPQDYMAIHASRRGIVIERHIANGSAAPRGQTLLSIADLSRVWVEADVYEADLDLISIGANAVVSLPYLPGRRVAAAIEYVYPFLQGKTRTGRVRLTLDNAAGDLKPGMYAEVSLQAALGHRLSVPEEAVIVAGESRVVFVDLGRDRLKPVRIQSGRRTQGFIEVLDGLAHGDKVVTSGNFLIAAETRLKTGMKQW